MKRPLCSVSALLLLCAHSHGLDLPEGGGDEPFVLVKKSRVWGGDSHGLLALREGASYLEKHAARDFIDYVYRASKSRNLMERGRGEPPSDFDGYAIVLGVAGEPPFENIDPRSMPQHGFRICTAPKRLYAVGQTEQGASNALYWLLREKVGVRWFMPVAWGEQVPVQKGIVLEPMDVTLGPDIPRSSRDARFYGSAGNRTRLGGRRDSFSRHIWSQILPLSEENKKNHPERFALTERTELPDKDWMLKFLWEDSQGKIRSGQVCTTNPDVLRLFIQKVLNYFRKNPDAMMHSVEPNDYHEFCICERCRALDKQLGDGPIMNRFVTFINQIADGIREEFPDKTLGIYAYSAHVDPPTSVKPDPMLVPTLCFFGGRACYKHSIDDPACPVNSAWKRDVFDPWVKLCPQFGYYSYYAYSGPWQGPQLMVKTLASDLKLIKKHNSYRFHVDGWANWATSAPMYYLFRRLPWDVDADYRVLLDEWYQGVYGPAYEPMKAYWETMIDGYYQGPCRGSKPKKPHLMFTPDVLAKAWKSIHTAKELTAERPDKYHRFVAIAEAGLQYTQAMTQGYALAAENKFAQAAEAGGRALEAIKSSRNLEPGPFITPMWPRDEHTWVWYTAWDYSNSSEIQTRKTIKQWQDKALETAGLPGSRLYDLPEMWRFRKDDNGQGEEQEWFLAHADENSWEDISTHRPWTSQSYPGQWHGTGWYRVDFDVDAEEQPNWYLHFGAIDGWAKVYLNGQLVDAHTEPPEKMWNKPWTVDISKFAKTGSNQLAVSVTKNEHAAGIYEPVHLRKAK
jgi:hypothetical protein